MRAQVLLHLILHVERKSVLQETADFSAVLSVAITDREEVAVLETHDVGRGDVGVLICFVRIMSCDTSFRRK